MTSLPRLTLVLLALLAAGCRQPDGEMPTPSPDTQEDLTDIGRDMMNIAGRSDPAAPEDLAYDLRKYAENKANIPVVEELSRRVAQAIVDKKLPEQTAQRLAHTLWLAVAAQELSERQAEALQDEAASMLLSIGAAEDQAGQVTAQVAEVQRAVTTRQRRWYEWF